MATQYVNVYEITRCYGGPEEGGWCYDTGTLIHSIKATTETAERIREELRKEYPFTGSRSSVRWSPDFDIYIEDEPGANWPAYRPHYE